MDEDIRYVLETIPIEDEDPTKEYFSLPFEDEDVLLETVLEILGINQEVIRGIYPRFRLKIATNGVRILRDAKHMDASDIATVRLDRGQEGEYDSYEEEEYDDEDID